jgi:hypothetical protein
MLAKTQTNPKYGGAIAAKGVQMLQNSGVINSEYLNEVNTFIRGSQEQQPKEQQTPTNSLEMDFNQ